MIELQRQRLGANLGERSSVSQERGATLDATPIAGADLPPLMQAPLVAYAQQMQVRLNATGIAFVWHGGRDSTAHGLAGAGSLQFPLTIAPPASRRASSEQVAQPILRWTHLGMDGEKQAQVDYSLNGGVISVIAAFDHGDGAREGIAALLVNSVGEGAPFFALLEAALEAQAIATRLRDAANLSGVGVIIADIHANVLFANDAAERICDHSKALRLTDGTLRAATLHDSLRLHAAIEHVVTQGENQRAAVPAIALTRARGRPIMITLSPLSMTASDCDKHGAIVCVFDPESEAAASVHPICEFYRLSAMESKIAELMAQGYSITEAADRLSLKEHTARSYLKQIFQKTGTNRQGELVALLLRTSVHCAPKQHISLVD